MPASRLGARRAFSLVEVLVAMAILIVGIVGILQFFPPSLRATAESSLRGQAALLAQFKVEEIRRDDTQSGMMVDAIQNLEDPTEPIAFPHDPRLAYQFHSRSILDGEDETAAPVARVIVRYDTAFRSSGDILYELRFDQ